ncbi:hypothetical protein CAOG_002502 [Capsaspora owczarzaki ATCC 30864]|uniref:Vacuolar protein sorting-associated protein 54 n=1 Tax=Capsaspora owczarzaki (strain ATCC 30864) TaxID=595528 RepID=A0A0D2WMG9_CAPO3|nr:hypothetical protein CAOG_002502 [Capsaspora owczarzaki ATCC 30864]
MSSVFTFNVGGGRPSASAASVGGSTATSSNASRHTTPPLTPLSAASSASTPTRPTTLSQSLAMGRVPIFMQRPHTLQANLARRDAQYIYTKTWGENFTNTPTPQPTIASLSSSYLSSSSASRGSGTNAAVGSGIDALLPEVNLSHFEAYLSKTAERNQRRLQSAAGWNAEHHRRESSATLSAGGSVMSEFTKDGVPVLSQVPSMFFEAQLDMSDQDVFDTIIQIPSLEHIRGTSLASNLQEKLSHYLDLVEMQLAKAVARRSDQFFAAMRSQEELFMEVHDTVKTIKFLRARVQAIDNMLTVQGLNIVRMSKKAERIQRVLAQLRIMSTVMQTHPTVELLLASSDFIGALDLLATTREVVSSELNGIHSMRHLSEQLKQMEEDVDIAMQQELQTLAIEVATSNRGNVWSLRQFGAAADERLPPAISFEQRVETTQDRILPVLLALVRQRNFECFIGYKSQVQLKLNALIKDTVAMFVANAAEDAHDSGDAQAKPSKLTDSIRHLTFRQWMQLLDAVFATLVDMLQGLRAVHQVIASVATACVRDETPQGGKPAASSAAATVSASALRRQGSELGADAGSNSIGATATALVSQPLTAAALGEIRFTLTAAHARRFVTDSDDIVRSAVELAQLRCGKILGVRANQTDRLAPRDFVSFYQLVDKFVMECDRVASSPSNSLRSTMAAQAKRFISAFHEQRLSTMNATLENERWRIVDVPGEFQTLANGIIELAEMPADKRAQFAVGELGGAARQTLQHPSKRLSRAADDDLFGPANSNGPAGGASLMRQPSMAAADLVAAEAAEAAADASASSSTLAAASASGVTNPVLTVGNATFRLPNCSLMLTKAISDYCQCALGLPGLTTEIQRRVVEILRLFNKRTWDLILGAGALELAGLKSINAKHLGLAAQAISVVLEYLPYIRAILAVGLSVKQQILLSELDSVTQDYFQHREQIFDKLAIIMGAVFERFYAPDFVLESSEADAGVTVSLKNVVKETVKLHKALSEVLSASDLEIAMQKVFGVLNKKLCEVFGKCDAKSSNGKKRAVADVAFFSSQLGSLSHAGDAVGDDAHHFVLTRFG